jgi:hypothetical protein
MDNHFHPQADSADPSNDDAARNEEADAGALLLAQLGASTGFPEADYAVSQSQHGGQQHQLLGDHSRLGFPFIDAMGAIRLHNQFTVPWGDPFRAAYPVLSEPNILRPMPPLGGMQSFGQFSPVDFYLAQQRSNVIAALSSVRGNAIDPLRTTNELHPTSSVPHANQRRALEGLPSPPTRSATSLLSSNALQPLLPQETAFESPRHDSLDLPPREEGPIDSHRLRASFPLGIEEDANWLSDFHCFVRSEMVEVFRASEEDARARNKSIAHLQIGLRCRFCAHTTPMSRACRSSAFPSTLRQLYQSFTMMLRDHFAGCGEVPSTISEKFASLKDKPSHGASDSKKYWIYAARKIGMQDTPNGLMMTSDSRAEGSQLPAFGSCNEEYEDGQQAVPLVLPADRSLTADFLYILMCQAQPVRLTEAECIGNRRCLKPGLPGFGCKYCCKMKRLGLCRMFPAKRRNLPTKMDDLYEHLQRCKLCPTAVRERIEIAKNQLTAGFHADKGGDREFFDRIWIRLGHSL